MLTAREFAQPKPAEEPYFRRRLAELVAEGKASVPPAREGGKRRSQEERAALKLSYVFADRLRTFLDLSVYYSPARGRLSVRRTNPRPALNGKVYVPPLPADAVLVGRYSYPVSRRDFMRDLLAVMGGRE